MENNVRPRTDSEEGIDCTRCAHWSECGYAAEGDTCDDWQSLDSATLERLLRCPCGGWLEAIDTPVQRGFEAYCADCHTTAYGDTPAAAIMAYRREHDM